MPPDAYGGCGHRIHRWEPSARMVSPSHSAAAAVTEFHAISPHFGSHLWTAAATVHHLKKRSQHSKLQPKKGPHAPRSPNPLGVRVVMTVLPCPWQTATLSTSVLISLFASCLCMAHRCLYILCYVHPPPCLRPSCPLNCALHSAVFFQPTVFVPHALGSLRARQSPTAEPGFRPS